MDDDNFLNAVIQSPKIDQEQVQNVFKESGIGGVVEFIKKNQDGWKKISLNIGVIGESGVGKSSIINALRNLTADDEGAAKVSSNQTTMIPTSYAHPNNPLLKLWDLPGVGTPQFPQKKYLEKIEFERFDFFLFISSSRFTENDAWLAESIRKVKKSFFFVRTKLSNDVNNDRTVNPHTHNKLAVIESIRMDVENSLKKLRPKKGSVHQEDRIFLIDSYKKDDYQFNTLVNCLTDEFPAMKRDALILSLNFCTEEMIKKKVAVLRKSLWFSSAISGAIAGAPVPFLSSAADLTIIGANIFAFYKTLGLDAHSRKQIAQHFDVSEGRLSSLVESEIPALQSLLGGKVTVEMMKMIGVSLTENGLKIITANVAQEVVRFIPIVGSIVAVPLSFCTTYFVLKKCLDKFEDTSLKLLKVCIDTSVNVEK